MPETTEPAIRRLQDGSIDYGYYANRGMAMRNRRIRNSVSRLLPGRVKSTPGLYLVGAVLVLAAINPIPV